MSETKEDAAFREAWARLWSAVDSAAIMHGSVRADAHETDVEAAVERAVIARLASQGPGPLTMTAEREKLIRGGRVEWDEIDTLRAKCAALSAQLEEVSRTQDAMVAERCAARIELVEAERDAAVRERDEARVALDELRQAQDTIVAERSEIRASDIAALTDSNHSLRGSNGLLEARAERAEAALRTERAQHERLREAARAVEEADQPDADGYCRWCGVRGKHDATCEMVALRSALTAPAPAEPKDKP